MCCSLDPPPAMEGVGMGGDEVEDEDEGGGGEGRRMREGVCEGGGRLEKGGDGEG